MITPPITVGLKKRVPERSRFRNDFGGAGHIFITKALGHVRFHGLKGGISGLPPFQMSSPRLEHQPKVGPADAAVTRNAMTADEAKLLLPAGHLFLAVHFPQSFLNTFE